MAKARHLHTPIYITRAVDTIIDQKINAKEGKVLFVHGDGGFGKSTLLRKYVQYGEKNAIPLIFIDLKEQTNSSMVNILLDEGITFVKNCPKFEEIRTMIIDEPELLSHILNIYTTEASSAVQRLTHGDENYQQIVGTILDSIKLWNKFSEREREAKKKAILNTPELLLLRALSEDLQGYGVCIIDTFEKIKLSLGKIGGYGISP
jgi:GTPase SAR1 family protein